MKRSVVALALLILPVSGSIIVLSYSTKNLELTVAEIGQVGESEVNVSIEACNPSILPVAVQGIEANLHGSSDSYGTIVTGAKSIPPLSEEAIQGTIDFTDFDSMKTVVGWILNNESNTDFNATVLVNEKLLDVIPYSYEQNYDLTEFSKMLFGNNQWACKQSHVSDIKQQLSMVQARISAASLIYSGKVGIVNGTQHTDLNSSEYNSSG